MAHCPFCEGEVDSDLVVFGGTCPKCFAEIPGEEAPTDPGEEVRAAQEQADRKTARKGMILPALLVGSLFVGVVGAAVYTVVAEPFAPEPVAVLDLGEETFDLGLEFAEAEPEPEAVAETAKAPTRRQAAKSSALERLQNLQNAEVIASPDGGLPTELGSAGPDAAEGPRGPRAVQGTDTDPDISAPELRTTTGPGLAGLDDIGFGGPSRKLKGVVLTDDNQIVEMLRAVLEAQMPKLRSCYEQRLKQNESLQGRWSLNFTVQKDGSVAGAVANPTGQSDPELEACLASRVARWEFQPIKADQPVTKSIVFRPSF